MSGLWKAGTWQVIDGMEQGRGLHTAGGVCTGVWRGAVGSVGNGVLNGAWSGGFSKCPEIHGRVLEKWGGVGGRMGSGLA